MSGLGESVFFEGIEKGHKEMIYKMFIKGISINEIAEITDLKDSMVEEIIKSHEMIVY